ncbi:MAG: PEP-CTERM sorting domain-containing protein [Coleofasciculaceae cyanobacterium SM2_3_26]|nr:PEP-CTERM sorting domain-containing protein [Coleofasciculaceae cyanobacterium SM2_3_26]
MMKVLTFGATSAALALTGISAPAIAASLEPGELFGTEGLLFQQDTEVSWEFLQSNGRAQSTLKLFEVGADDALTFVTDLFAEVRGSDSGLESDGWLGTCGISVLPTEGGACLASTILKSGIEYTLALDSGDRGTVFSTSRLNVAPSDTQQVAFGTATELLSKLPEQDGIQFTEAADFTSADPLSQRVAAGFDDRGNMNDSDFQDFVITAEATRVDIPKEVPEPSVVLALVGGIVGFSVVRRRQG